MSGETIRNVNTDQYIYNQNIKYVEIDRELLDIEAHLREGMPLLQYGPPGTGKTRSFAHYGAEHDIPVIHFDCTKDAKKSDFIIRPWIEVVDDERQSVYIPGALPLAIIAANEHNEAILVLEELNALTPHLQKNMLSVTDWREQINVPEADHTFSLNDGADLLIGATMNPSDITSGVFDLNPELRDRFSELRREFPSKRKLANILRKNNTPDQIAGVDSIIEKQIVPFINSVNALVNNNEVEYALSPRHGVRIGIMWEQYYQLLDRKDDEMNPVMEGLRRALKSTVLGKYRDEDEREVIKDQITQAFPVAID